MKLYFFSASFLLSILSFTAAAEPLPPNIEHLYLIGDASPSGWSLQDAPELSLHDGVLTWTGPLGRGQFKLATSRSDYNSIVSANYDNFGVIPDYQMPIQYNPASGDADFKWFNNTPDYYTISVDLENQAITISPLTQVFLVGSASPSGWSRVDDPVLLKNANGDFVWHGHLSSGEFKLALSPYTWDSFVSASESNHPVRYLAPMPIQYNPDVAPNDWKWVNNIEGDYTISLNIIDNSIRVSRDIDELYLIGDASPGGWSQDAAQQMSFGNDGIFSWTGFLNQGTFKFILARDSWDSIVSADCDSYGVVYDAPMVIAYGSGNDWKWFNSAPGLYTVKVNILDNTISVEPISSPIYLVGDAAPGGWNRGDAPELIPDNDGVYFWSGHLEEGLFKFLVDRFRWDSLGSDSDAHRDVQLNSPMHISYNNSGDFQWYNTTPGDYRIAVDLRHFSLTVSPVTELFLIGDAAPGGWNRGDAPVLTSTDNVNFHWSGYLARGQFKILKSRDSWDCFTTPEMDNRLVILDTDMSMTDGGDDFKWFNFVPGEYQISLNTQSLQIRVSPLRGGFVDPENIGFHTSQFNLEQVAPGLFRYCGTLDPGEYRVTFSDRTSLHAVSDNSFEKSANAGFATTFTVTDPEQPMQIFVHPELAHLTFAPYSPWETLYAVGSFNDWSFSNQFELIDNDTFRWEGFISTDNGSEFKIVGSTDWNPAFSLHPYTPDEQFDQISHFFVGGTAPSRAKANAEAVDHSDHKWKITEPGFHRLTVNLFTREMAVLPPAIMSSVNPADTDPSVSIFVRDAHLNVITPQPTHVSVYNIAGQLIKSLNCNGHTHIPLPHGAYIVHTPHLTTKIIL